MPPTPQPILLVDPNPVTLASTRQNLESAPGPLHHILTAADQPTALAFLADPALPIPHVILLSGLHVLQPIQPLLDAAPSAVFLLLAAPEDLPEALAAANRHNLFRVLSTPVLPEALIHAVISALDAAATLLRQRSLLDHTLPGSIRLLNDVLSAADPEAFFRSLRIARTMAYLLTCFPLPDPWRFQIAATLSQLGCVTIDSEIVQKAFAGAPLTPAERTRFNSHPQRSQEMLAHVPGLEPSAWVIGQQLQPQIPAISHLLAALPSLTQQDAASIHLAARLLKLATAYESLCVTLVSEAYVLVRLQNCADEFGPELVQALTHVGPREPMTELRRLPMNKLKAGMILEQELRSRQGLLVVGRGQEVTRALLFRLENFARTGLADREVMARITI